MFIRVIVNGKREANLDLSLLKLNPSKKEVEAAALEQLDREGECVADATADYDESRKEVVVTVPTLSNISATLS